MPFLGDRRKKKLVSFSVWIICLQSEVSHSILFFPLFLLRECAVKFNDYFEFPRDIDMEPFTEVGLAKLQGQLLETANYLL